MKACFLPRTAVQSCISNGLGELVAGFVAPQPTGGQWVGRILTHRFMKPHPHFADHRSCGPAVSDPREPRCRVSLGP